MISSSELRTASTVFVELAALSPVAVIARGAVAD
jgi:hypothetical protein